MDSENGGQPDCSLETVRLCCELCKDGEEVPPLSKDETLPDTDYDAVIVGTGLVESIVSAALSRIGKAVLHLDQNMYYGSEWAAMPLNAKSPLGPFQERWRQFSLDRSPKFLYSRGAMVNLLTQSKVSRYLEFRCVGRTLSYIDGKMVEVPCSAADVFNTNLLKLAEKNVIKRFLTFCLEHDQHSADYEGYSDRPFKDFLAKWPLGKKAQLSAFLQRLVLHSIAMCGGAVSTADGLKATQYYLRSIGRFGNTPFLWPMYGSGELPQAYCRMSAVFGGVFVLNRALQSISVSVSEDNTQCNEATCNLGQKLKFKWLLLNKQYCPQSWHVTADSSAAEGDGKPTTGCQVARAVLLTDRSISPATAESGIEEPFLLTIPPCEDLHTKHVTHLVELPSSTSVCPRGCYVVQMTAIGESAEDDFSTVVDRLFRRKAPDTPSSLTTAPGEDSAAAAPAASSDDRADDGDAPPPAAGDQAPGGEEAPRTEVADAAPADVSAAPATSEHDSLKDSSDPRPVIYESFYFTQHNPECRPTTSSGAALDNVLIPDCANPELGYLAVVKQAREFFDAICPGEEFLPPAPEPEDICYGATDAEKPDASGESESSESKEKQDTSGGSAETNAEEEETQHSAGSKEQQQEEDGERPSPASDSNKDSTTDSLTEDLQ